MRPREFTIPKRIRPFFRYNSSLLGQLPRLAAKVISDFYREALGDDAARPGIAAAMQTFNSDHTHNPNALCHGDHR